MIEVSTMLSFAGFWGSELRIIHFHSKWVTHLAPLLSSEVPQSPSEELTGRIEGTRPWQHIGALLMSWGAGSHHLKSTRVNLGQLLSFPGSMAALEYTSVVDKVLQPWGGHYGPGRLAWPRGRSQGAHYPRVSGSDGKHSVRMVRSVTGRRGSSVLGWLWLGVGGVSGTSLRRDKNMMRKEC